MPKMKTHRGAKARFKVTGSGKIMRRHQGKNHLLQKKSSGRKRRLAIASILSLDPEAPPCQRGRGHRRRS